MVNASKLNGDHFVFFSAIKTFASNKDDRKRVEKVLENMGIPSTKNDSISIEKFGYDEFFSFYKSLTQRTEIERVFYEM